MSFDVEMGEILSDKNIDLWISDEAPMHRTPLGLFKQTLPARRRGLDCGVINVLCRTHIREDVQVSFTATPEHRSQCSVWFSIV